RGKAWRRAVICACCLFLAAALHRAKRLRSEHPCLVLRDQNALAHAVATCCATRTGTVKQNVEPWPTFDSTQILPPCIPMMRLDIASPRPVPPFLRVIALSAC